MASRSLTSLLTLSLALCALPALAQPKAAPLTDALKENFIAEHELGRRFSIDPAQLPAPKSSPIVTNRPLTLPAEGHVPQVPAGFQATLRRWARPSAPPPRVAERGRARRRAERRLPHAPARRGRRHGDVDHAPCRRSPSPVWPRMAGRPCAGGRPGCDLARAAYARCRARGASHARATGRAGAAGGPQALSPAPMGPSSSPRRRLRRADRAPESAPRGRSQDRGLFVGVGSSGNLGVEPEPKATIQRFEADGGHQKTYASGVRNPTGLAFHPQTGDLWAVVQERDGLGDNLPSDYLIRVQEGGFYGWPYAYIGPHPQPGFAIARPPRSRRRSRLTSCSRRIPRRSTSYSTMPRSFQSRCRAAPSWPSRGRGTAPRRPATRWYVPFKDGKPVGYYENFMTGFWASGERRAEVWGRPAALAIAKDGALLVADDTGGTIWKVRYTGEGQVGAPAAVTTGTATAKTRSEHARRTGPSAQGRPVSADRRLARPVQSPCLWPLRTIMHVRCRPSVEHGRLSRSLGNAPEKSVTDFGYIMGGQHAQLASSCRSVDARGDVRRRACLSAVAAAQAPAQGPVPLQKAGATVKISSMST